MTQKAIMQTNPEQWAVELWHLAYNASENCATQSFGDDDKAAALAIQTAFAEREARLVGALAKGGFMMTETHNIGEHRARKLVIGFQNGSDADLAMEAVAIAIKAYRDAT